MQTTGNRERYTRQFTFSSMLECGYCGHKLSRRTRHQTTMTKRLKIRILRSIIVFWKAVVGLFFLGWRKCIRIVKVSLGRLRWKWNPAWSWKWKRKENMDKNRNPEPTFWGQFRVILIGRHNLILCPFRVIYRRTCRWVLTAKKIRRVSNSANTPKYHIRLFVLIFYIVSIYLSSLHQHFYRIILKYMIIIVQNHQL
jgi:hypothetical protein